MAENMEGQQSAQKTRKEKFMERMRSRKPDLDFDDEEALYGAIDDDYSDMEGRLGRFTEESGKIKNMLASDPRSAVFLTEWAKGGNPLIKMVERYGDDFLAALQDPEKREEFAEAHRKWLDRVSENRKLEEQAEANLAETFSTLERMQKENGWSEQQTAKIFETANSIFVDGITNIIRPETFTMIANALNYDNAVSEAERLGEVRGRNEQIENRLRKSEPQPGMPPTLGGAGGAGGEQMPKKKKRYRNAFMAGGYREDEE